MTSAERDIASADPGASTPGSGGATSTGKNSKPVEGAPPAPDSAAATEESTPEPPDSVEVEAGERTAGLEPDPRAVAEAAVLSPEAGDVAEPDEVAADEPEPEDELGRALAQRDEYLTLAQRTQADFENYRKRAAREAKNSEARAVMRVVKELLPALDNLGRALSGAQEDDPLLAGVRLVHQDLAAALRRHGVEAYSPEGERFDPAEHEAMAQQPVEGVSSGTVVEVYQPGYRLDGTVIRPARVVVAA